MVHVIMPIQGGMHMADNEKLDLVLSKLSDIAQEITELEQETRELKRRITSIELSIENEVRNNINIVAEGHSRLMDRLNEVSKTERDNMMYLIRFNMLETDVRKIKEKIKLA